MTITDKADFKAKVRASMCQLQNDPEKIRTKNYRSNMPPDSAFTYGLINNSYATFVASHKYVLVPDANADNLFAWLLTREMRMRERILKGAQTVAR